MTIVYDSDSLLTRLVWETANFASGGGTTNLAWSLPDTSLPTVEDVLALIVTAWTTNLRTVTDSDLTLAFIAWETETQSGLWGVGLAGTGNITSPPPNSAILCSYAGSGKGPRNRGRNYWPGLISENNVDERGVINPSSGVQIQGDIDDFFDQVLASVDVTAQCIAQSTTPGEQSSPILPWPQVKSRVVQPVMATQRRRLRR